MSCLELIAESKDYCETLLGRKSRDIPNLNQQKKENFKFRLSFTFEENSQENMKKLGLLGLLALVACQNNSESSESEATANTKSYPSYEQMEVELNDQVVYGVIVKDSAGAKISRGYSITFKLRDKVWYDTVYLEMSTGEVAQSESVFAEAIVDDMGGAQFEVTTFDVQ